MQKVRVGILIFNFMCMLLEFISIFVLKLFLSMTVFAPVDQKFKNDQENEKQFLV